MKAEGLVDVPRHDDSDRFGLQGGGLPSPVDAGALRGPRAHQDIHAQTDIEHDMLPRRWPPQADPFTPARDSVFSVTFHETERTGHGRARPALRTEMCGLGAQEPEALNEALRRATAALPAAIRLARRFGHMGGRCSRNQARVSSMTSLKAGSTYTS